MRNDYVPSSPARSLNSWASATRHLRGSALKRAQFERSTAVFRLTGSLSDGPLWAIGSKGPVPVDPWGPKYRAQVRDARGKVVSGMKALQKLGKTLGKSRLAAGKSAPPEVDPALPDWAKEKLKATKPKRAVKRAARARANTRSKPAIRR